MREREKREKERVKVNEREKKEIKLEKRDPHRTTTEQGLWFANPGGSNSMPSRTHSSVQRTRSLPVHTNPHTLAMFQQSDLQVPVNEPDINNRLESLCLSMTEHALGAVGEAVYGVEKTKVARGGQRREGEMEQEGEKESDTWRTLVPITTTTTVQNI
ncbi:hypothetical protein NFI96_004263 [Prochilodus magdalenae]|nr:hypothetical protein NFI96_004263 [Prochilodus magdalenae]